MDRDNLAKIFVEQKNKTPLDEFDGLSPEEMYHIVYFPFSDECSIQVNSKLDNSSITHAPIFKIVLELLSVIAQEGGLKLTSKGNIQPQIVKEIYNKKYLIDYFIENGITKLQREGNWLIFHTIKIVLNLSGITRKYKGKLLLTKQTINNLKNDEQSKIFLKFLIGYTTQFNWAYNDGYDKEEIGQIGFLYLLYLLNKYGDKYRDLKYYTELYFIAFPSLDFEEKKAYGLGIKDSERIVEIRFINHFTTWFGFVDIQYNEKNNYFSGIYGIKKTKLLNKLVIQN